MGVVVAVECLEGLADLVAAEVAELVPAARIIAVDPTEVRATVDAADVHRLLALRTAVAVHLVLGFDVPRPKALLGSEALGRLRSAIDGARLLHPPDAFTGLRLNAAGSDSSVLQRLRAQLAAATGLRDDPDAGDLLLRLRRSGDGWEVLVRLSPRPLSARPWRVARYDAASNATVAAAMVRLTGPAPTDSFVDLTCGTGTLLIERAAAGPARRIVGCDIDPDVLELAAANLAGAGAGEERRVRLVHHDARRMAELGDTYDVLVANLPWGTRSGSHTENDELYPAILDGAAAVARPGARFVVLTHDVRRFEHALAGQSRWTPVAERRVFQKGHHPRIHVLS